jgi:hypothetical protein
MAHVSEKVSVAALEKGMSSGGAWH